MRFGESCETAHLDEMSRLFAMQSSRMNTYAGNGWAAKRRPNMIATLTGHQAHAAALFTENVGAMTATTTI
jgi:hypothetical protein